MLRLRIILWGTAFLLFSSWLYSEEVDPSGLAGAIKNIEATLQQLQKEIKDLHSSMKELARSGKKKNEARPAALPVIPGAPSSLPAWQQAQELYERGRRAEDLKACEPAIEAFTQAIQLDPKNDSAFLHRGYCRYDLGDYANAVSDLNQSLAIQPNNSRAYAKRAEAYSASGQTSAALQDANEAIQRDGRNPANYLLRAGLEQQLGRFQEAGEDYEKAIALAPASDTPYLARAAFLRNQGQVQKSLEDCYKAIQVNSADGAAYLCRAQFYLATGAAQPALEDINRAMLMGHGPAEAKALLSSAQKILSSQEPRPTATLAADLPAALPLTSALVRNVSAISQPRITEIEPPALPAPETEKTVPPEVSDRPRRQTPARIDTPVNRDANFFYRTGRSSSEQEKFDEALSAFNEALRLDPKNPVVRNARGYAYLRLRQYREAIADFNEALRLNPTYANAYRNRAAALASEGTAAGSR